MRKLVLAIGMAAVLLLGLGALSPSEASCSATQDCNNACSLEIECPPPFQPWPRVCSASSQVLTCSGPNATSTCSSTSNSVTCDGVTKTCSTQWCRQTSTSVTCGSTTKTCQQCQTGPACPF